MSATFVLISPEIAAQSLLPWILYLGGNLIWLVDVSLRRDVPWIAMSTFFSVWDAIIIVTRIYHIELLHYIQPFVDMIRQMM